MVTCSACKKNSASITVLDLSGGKLQDAKQLCAACAQTAGMVQPKPSTHGPTSSEILEDLIGAVGGKGRGRKPPSGAQCAGCGLTAAEFRARGRFGCERCYATFRELLMPLLERVHDAARHTGRKPVPGARQQSGVERKHRALSDLRRRLEAAIDQENYEEAADLRDQLRTLETRSESDPKQGA